MFLTSFLSNGKEPNISPLDKLSENLQFIVSPTDEDNLDSYLNACACISNKIQSSWTANQVESFSKELDEFANKIGAAFSQSDVELFNEPPRPSETLLEHLQHLTVFVSECEEEHNVTLEF